MKKRGVHMKRERRDLIIAIVALLVVVILVGLTGLLYIAHSMSANVNTSSMIEDLEETVPADLEEQLEMAREEGREEVLSTIKSYMEADESYMAAFRAIYQDEIVVAADGKVQFIPISDMVTPSTFEYENLRVLEDGVYEYHENGVVSSKKGIDVSKYQEDIDWKAVAEDGVEYAFIRVGIRGYGSGEIVEDATFGTNAKEAAEAGIAVGAYFFSQAITVEEAKEEAQFVLEQIRDYEVTYPIVIDIEKIGEEGARADRLSKEERTDIAIAFCEEIIAAGRVPMIYGNTETFAIMLEIERIADYERWIAFYDDELVFPYEFSVWQYTHQGSVDGIQGDTDLNISFKTW